MGKKNPVTLVRTVVIRKTFVQPGSRCAVSMPYDTTKPDRIPARLMATWIKVSAFIGVQVVALPGPALRLRSGSALTQQAVSTPRWPVPNERRRRLSYFHNYIECFVSL